MSLTRAAINEVILGRAKLPQLIAAGSVKVAGNEKTLQEVLGLLGTFDFWFDIVTANSPPEAKAGR